MRGNGRPATNTRLLVALHYLKYTFNLSDEAVWQHFCGNQYFEHSRLIDPMKRARSCTLDIAGKGKIYSVHEPH